MVLHGKPCGRVGRCRDFSQGSPEDRASATSGLLPFCFPRSGLGPLARAAAPAAQFGRRCSGGVRVAGPGASRCSAAPVQGVAPVKGASMAVWRRRARACWALRSRRFSRARAVCRREPSGRVGGRRLRERARSAPRAGLGAPVRRRGASARRADEAQPYVGARSGRATALGFVVLAREGRPIWARRSDGGPWGPALEAARPRLSRTSPLGPGVRARSVSSWSLETSGPSGLGGAIARREVRTSRLLGPTDRQREYETERTNAQRGSRLRVTTRS